MKIKYVNINNDGSIDIQDLENILSNDNSKKLITLMHVNNEIGKILDLKKFHQFVKNTQHIFILMLFNLLDTLNLIWMH